MHPLLRLQRAAVHANLSSSYDPPPTSSSSDPSSSHPHTTCPVDIPSQLTPPFSKYLLSPDSYLASQSQQDPSSTGHTSLQQQNVVQPWKTISSSSGLMSDPMFDSSIPPATTAIHHAREYYYSHPNQPELSNIYPSSFLKFNSTANTNPTEATNSLPMMPIPHTSSPTPLVPAPIPPPSPSSHYHHHPSLSSYTPPRRVDNDHNFPTVPPGTNPPMPSLSLSLSSASNHSSPISLLDAFNSPPPSSPVATTGFGGSSATGGAGASIISSGLTSRPGSAGISFSKSPLHTHIEENTATLSHYQHYPFDPHHHQPFQSHEHHGHQQEQYTHPFTISDFAIQAAASLPLDNLPGAVNQVSTLEDVMQHSACLSSSMQPLGGRRSVGGNVASVDANVASFGAHAANAGSLSGPPGSMGMDIGLGLQSGVGMQGFTLTPSTVSDMEMLEAVFKLIDTPADPGARSEMATAAHQGSTPDPSVPISGEMNCAPMTSVPNHNQQEQQAREHQSNPNMNMIPQRNRPDQPIIHNNREALSSPSYQPRQHSAIPNNPGTEAPPPQSGFFGLGRNGPGPDPTHENAGVIVPRTRGPALVTLGLGTPSQVQPQQQNQHVTRQLEARAYDSSQQQQQQEEERAPATQAEFFDMHHHHQQQHQAMKAYFTSSESMTVSPVATVSPTQFQFQVSSSHPYFQPHPHQHSPAPARVQSTSAIVNHSIEAGAGVEGMMGRRRGWSMSSNLSVGTKRKRGAGGSGAGGLSLSISVPTSPTSSRRPDKCTPATTTTADSADDDEEGNDDDGDDEGDADYEDGARKKRSRSGSDGSERRFLGSTATEGRGAPKRKPRKRASTLASPPSVAASRRAATIAPRPASAGNGAAIATITSPTNPHRSAETTAAALTPAPMTTVSGRPIRSRRTSSGRQSLSPSSTAAGPDGSGVNGSMSASAKTTTGGKIGRFPRKRRCELCRRLKTKCTYAPEMQKCTTCAERGDNVLCVLVEHGSAKAKAEAQAQAQAQQQQSNPAASPTQMNGDLHTKETQQPPSSTSVPAEGLAPADNTAVPEGYAPPSIIIKRIVSPEEVKTLFRIFFERMNPYAVILDETIHTVPHVLVRYPLVFATVCAMASRFLTSRPDLHAVTTSLALDSLAPHIAAPNTTATTTVATNIPTASADASIALAILALWTGPRSIPSTSSAASHTSSEVDETGGLSQSSPSSTTTKGPPAAGLLGDDRHSWSACALRMAEAMHAAMTVKSSAQQAKSGDESKTLPPDDPLASPVRVLGICQAVDRRVRLNFSFTTSSPPSPFSSSPMSTPYPPMAAKGMTGGGAQQQQLDLAIEADRAARAMAQLLRMMNPSGTGTADRNSSIQSCAFELDSILHTLVATQRGHLCATPAMPPPLAYTSVAVQASFYRLVAYTLQSTSSDSHGPEHMMEQESPCFNALLGQAIDHACGTLQMVYETTKASEGLLGFAPEPMLAKVVSIGLYLVHVLRLVPTHPTNAADHSIASTIISQLHLLIEHLRSIAVDDNHSPALYSQLLSETLRTSTSVSSNHMLSQEQCRHMLLQLPYFLLQKALWPLGTTGRSIRST